MDYLVVRLAELQVVTGVGQVAGVVAVLLQVEVRGAGEHEVVLSGGDVLEDVATVALHPQRQAA